MIVRPTKSPDRRRLFAQLAFAGALAFAAPAAAGHAPESFADLAEAVTPAVVNISATQVEEDKDAARKLPPGASPDQMLEEFLKRRRGRGGQGLPHRSTSLGSGFVIDPSGVVVTNNHVIDGANDIEVIFADGTKLRATIVGVDAKVDVAVLRVKAEKSLPTVKFGDSDKVRVGDWVIAVGDPFALGSSVTAGIISAKGRNIESGPYDNFLQTDAAINKGNSGGPLFDMAGEVVGVNTAILSPSGGSIGIGFATPSNTAAPVIDQLIKYGETRRGWLGMRIQNVDDALAESLGIGKARGALIDGIDESGPSAHAGFKPGDVVVTFDGKAIGDARELPKIVALTPVGKEVEVVVIRDGKELTRKVTLGRLEERDAQAAKAGKGPAEPQAPPERRAPPENRTHALGMDVMALTDALRSKFHVGDSVRTGVVVVGVDGESAAAEQHIAPGDVILEINRRPAGAPQDLAAEAKALKEQGRKTALLLIVGAQSRVRFVALPLN
jgi:serine protease Do